MEIGTPNQAGPIAKGGQKFALLYDEPKERDKEKWAPVLLSNSAQKAIEKKAKKEEKKKSAETEKKDKEDKSKDQKNPPKKSNFRD